MEPFFVKKKTNKQNITKYKRIVVMVTTNLVITIVIIEIINIEYAILCIGLVNNDYDVST